jgi:hypothetical protein
LYLAAHPFGVSMMAFMYFSFLENGEGSFMFFTLSIFVPEKNFKFYFT